MASQSADAADDLSELIRRLEIRVEQQRIAVTMVGDRSRSRELLEEQLRSYQDMLSYLRHLHANAEPPAEQPPLELERRIA
jgi:hypothetical protein